MKAHSAAALFILNFAHLSSPLACGADWTAAEIAEKAREIDRESLRKYGPRVCNLVEIKEDLSEKGKVEHRQVQKLQLTFSSVPIPGDKETHRISPETRKVGPLEDSSVLDHLEMFDWKLEAEDDSQGEPCYRLAFNPKKVVKDLGARHAVISQSRGRCWVAKRDFAKIRLEGQLARPIEVLGFLVTVREVDFLTTTRRMAEGVAVPLQTRYRFRVEVFPFFEFHERHTQEFEFPALAKN